MIMLFNFLYYYICQKGAAEEPLRGCLNFKP